MFYVVDAYIFNYPVCCKVVGFPPTPEQEGDQQQSPSCISLCRSREVLFLMLQSEFAIASDSPSLAQLRLCRRPPSITQISSTHSDTSNGDC